MNKWIVSLLFASAIVLIVFGAMVSAFFVLWLCKWLIETHTNILLVIAAFIVGALTVWVRWQMDDCKICD